MNRDLLLRDNLAAERTLLANQRTLLAFVRTGLYLLVTALAIYKFIEIRNNGWIVWTMAISSVVVMLIGTINFFIVRKKIRKTFKAL